jgi:hypothetical protein
VSGRTSFLVVGNFAGRSKVSSARAKAVPLIDEDGLFSLIVASAPLAQQAQQAGEAEEAQQAGEEGEGKILPQQAQQAGARAQQVQHAMSAAAAGRPQLPTAISGAAFHARAAVPGAGAPAQRPAQVLVWVGGRACGGRLSAGARGLCHTAPPHCCLELS